MKRFHCVVSAGAATAALVVSTAFGHGYVGDRLFPPTITTDDPFAVDELSLNMTYFEQPGGDNEPATDQLSAGFEFVKEIFPRFAIGVSDAYFRNHTLGTGNQYGWDNVGVTVKYELWHNDPHEAIVSIGLDTDIGGSGSKTIADPTTVFTPTLFFGKGFGDLPDSASLLKPLAVTGTVGQTFPTDARVPNALNWGLAVEYSLPYLQNNVRDVGLPRPIARMVPLCEFAFESPENRGGGVTTGTINPGVLFETRMLQIGVEALIPVNNASGDNVGVTVQLQIFIDDLLPSVFGHPIFGKR
jgi:hypothetical protein